MYSNDLVNNLTSDHISVLIVWLLKRHMHTTVYLSKLVNSWSLLQVALQQVYCFDHSTTCVGVILVRYPFFDYGMNSFELLL